MILFDAHCHVQDQRLAGRVTEIIVRARAAGVIRGVCCGSEENDWPLVAELYQQYPDWLIPSFGVHPWYAARRSALWLERLEDFLRAVPSGVGEIGLDFAITNCDPGDQLAVFSAQLDLARRLRRPVSIHCRKAWEVLIGVVEKGGPLPAGGIMHSYSGSPELVSRFERLGLSLSFSGSITRSGNKKGARAVNQVSPNHLLIETDTPDIPAVGVEGFSEPAHLVLTVKAVAAILERSEEEIARRTSENASRIFGGISADD